MKKNYHEASNKAWIFSIVVLFISFNFNAFGHLNDSSKAGKNLKIRMLPAAYYLPETRAAFGGLAYSIFHRRQDSLNRPSTTQHYFSITQNRQILFENAWQVFLGGNKWINSGSADINRFPELYFGIGNHEPMPMPIYYGSNRYALKNQFLRHFSKSVYLGLSSHFEHLDCIHDQKSKMTMGNSDLYNTLEDYTAFGIGPTLVVDTRDFSMNAGKGSYIEIQYRVYKNLHSSNFSFLSLDVRRYIPLPKIYSILAFHGILQHSFGNAPFRLLPSLGGPGMLRGTYAGRFRDNVSSAIQSELRVKVYKRFGMAFFTGIGNVSPTFSGIFDYLKLSYGAGIRWRLHKNDNVNLRLDYARSLDSDGIYLVLAEAF